MTECMECEKNFDLSNLKLLGGQYYFCNPCLAKLNKLKTNLKLIDEFYPI